MSLPGLRRTRGVLLVLACALLGACSALQSEQDPELEYRQAGEGRPLELPPDLVKPDADPQFLIPSVDRDLTTALTRNTVLPAPEGVRLVREGAQVWIEIDRPPASLWPTLQGFWRAHNYELERDEPLLGLQETGWIDRRPVVPATGFSRYFGWLISDKYSGSLQDKFRFRLERVANDSGPDSSRLFVTHWGMSEEVANPENVREVVDTYWVRVGGDPAMRAEIINYLMLYLGIEAQKARGLLSEVQARQIRQRAYLVQNLDSRTNLILNLSFDRAWLRLQDALESAGLAIDESDRENGLFEVGYIGPKPQAAAALESDAPAAEPVSLFKRLFSSADSIERNFIVRVIEEPGQTRVVLQDPDTPSADDSVVEAFYRRLLQQFE